MPRNQKYSQDEIAIPCGRIETALNVNETNYIDLVWIDLQGAEKIAFESMGRYLIRARYIHCEVTHKPIYSGQILFDELDEYLRLKGFQLQTPINRNRWQENSIYKNNNLDFPIW